MKYLLLLLLLLMPACQMQGQPDLYVPYGCVPEEHMVSYPPGSCVIRSI